MSEVQAYELVIVGSGPAGLAAGLYAARDRYRTLLIEKNGLPGGQIMLTEEIENYPGIVRSTGFELIEQMKTQCTNFGAEFAVNQAVTGVKKRDDGLIEVQVNKGEKTYLTHGLILSPGSDYRQLGVPGEQEMRQATRVSYCATCDGAFYRDKHVLTVGGGNTAVEDTVYLATRFAKKVTMVHRRTEFRAQKILVEELEETAKDGKIDIKLPCVLEEIVPDGDGTQIDHVRLRNVETDLVEKLHVDGVFIFVGMIPNTKFLDGVVELDESGYVVADCATMRTPVPGIWVAGDCRQNAAMQLATAVSDGVIAALELKDYLRDPSMWQQNLGPQVGSGW